MLLVDKKLWISIRSLPPDLGCARQNMSKTRSQGALRAPTSSWRPFGPLDFVLRTLSQRLWALRLRNTCRYLCQSQKLSKLWSFCQQQISSSSFYFRDIATGSFNQEIQKYMNPDIRNPEIHFSFENLTSSRKSGHFAISGFPVALFVSEIWPSNIQKSLFLEIWKALENWVVLRAADLC